MRTDGQRHDMTKLTVPFRNFAKAPTKYIYIYKIIIIIIIIIIINHLRNPLLNFFLSG